MDDEDTGCRCSERRGGSAAPCWWTRGHVWDYALVAALFAVAAAVHFGAAPHTTVVPNTTANPTVLFPYLRSAIPSALATVLAYGAPVAAALLWNLPVLAARPAARRAAQCVALHDVHHALLGVATAAATDTLVTVVLKTLAGRPRPHHYARIARAAALAAARALSPAETAAFVAAAAAEARRSFPSGHTSTAFAGLGFLALYLAGKTRAFSRARARHGGALWRVAVVLAPLLAAMVVGVSRTRDYHHNYSDVLAGAAIGALTAATAYFALYPSLLSRYCAAPKSLRGDGDDTHGTKHTPRRSDENSVLMDLQSPREQEQEERVGESKGTGGSK